MSGDATKEVAPGSAIGLAANLIQSLDANGFTLGSSDRVNGLLVTYSWIALRAEANSLRVGSYSGNGAASRAITGAGFQPEYVAVLGATAQQAVERFAGMGRTYQFNGDTGATNRITSLDADGFTVGADATTNSNGATYHYIALNDRPANIKVGSYTGNNTDNRNLTGVGFAPAYVLIRANDAATARIAMHRPTSLTGDSTLSFTNAFNAANAIQALQSDGFQLGTNANVNASAVAYHYLALKDKP